MGCVGLCGGQNLNSINIGGNTQTSCGVANSLYGCYEDCGSGDNKDCLYAGSYTAWDSSNEGRCPASTCRGYMDQPKSGCVCCVYPNPPVAEV